MKCIGKVGSSTLRRPTKPFDQLATPTFSASGSWLPFWCTPAGKMAGFGAAAIASKAVRLASTRMCEQDVRRAGTGRPCTQTGDAKVR
jgi:hypothetical protein